MIDALERHDVATVDVVGAYLNAEMLNFVLLHLTGETINIMCRVNPKEPSQEPSQIPIANPSHRHSNRRQIHHESLLPIHRTRSLKNHHKSPHYRIRCRNLRKINCTNHCRFPRPTRRKNLCRKPAQQQPQIPSSNPSQKRPRTITRTLPVSNIRAIAGTFG